MSENLDCATRAQLRHFIEMDTRRIKDRLNDLKTDPSADVCVKSRVMSMDVTITDFKVEYRDLFCSLKNDVQKIKDANPKLFVSDVFPVIVENGFGAHFYFNVILRCSL